MKPRNALILFILCVAAVWFAVARSEFIPAPDLDAPKVYRKACIYCRDCTPPLCISANIYDRWYVTAESLMLSGESNNCYRCQRTGKRMVFDSVGVVVFGSWMKCDTTWNDHYMEVRHGDLMLTYEPGTFVIAIDTTIIADTSGVRRIE